MVLLYIILRTLFPPYSCTEDTNRQLITLLQGTFLPVLTLVLGYFFGSKLVREEEYYLNSPEAMHSAD